MSRYPDPAEMADRAASAAALPWLARCLVLGKGVPATALYVADGMAAPERVKTMLKAAVSAGNDTTAGALGTAYAGAQSAFADALGDTSAYFRIWRAGSAGFLRVPLRIRFVAATADATASLVSDGRPIPMTSLALSGSWLEPRTAAAICAFTDEVWRNVTASGQAFVHDQLRQAVGSVVDAAFFDAIVSTGTDVFSVDADDEAAVLAGLRRLLDAVNTRAGTRLFWVAGPTAANRLAVLSGLNPAPSPTGGTLLGLPLVLSMGVEPGQLALVDAASIAADLGLLELASSTEAALQFGDTPVDGAASMVSLWQSNAAAVRAVQTFGCEAFRPDALAIMEMGAGS